MSTRRALRAVRDIRSARGGPSAMDLAYVVYATALTILIVGFPVLRAVVLELAEPAAAAGLVTYGPTATAVASGLAASALVVAGGARGPAFLSPFLTAALAGSGLPRARTLLRPLAWSVLAGAGIGAAAALIPGIALLVSGDAAPGPVVAFGGAGALAGMTGVGAWLLGQRLGAGARAVVAAVLLGSTLLALASPTAAAAVTPWGWLATTFPTGGADPAGGAVATTPLVALAVLAAAVPIAAPALLAGLRGPELLAQAQRWQAASTLAVTGDLAMAAGAFRPVPRVGRGLRAVRGRRPLALIARRDLVGALRTPARFASACLGTATSGYLVSVALGGAGVALWIPGLAAALVGFLALGVWSDGARHVIDVASSPPLYGIPTPRLLAMHAVLPAVAGVACALAGSGIAVVGGADAAGLLVAPLAALVLVVVRILDAAKGPLPLEVMAPVNTPAGDASALVVAAWQADALILACGSVVAIVSATTAYGPVGAVVALPVGAFIAYRVRGRLERGRG